MHVYLVPLSQALVEVLLESIDCKGHKEKLVNDHKANHLLGKIGEKADLLEGLYEDVDG